MVAYVLAGIGAALIVAGVAMLSIPAAFIAAGVGAVAVALFVETDDRGGR